MRNTKVINLVYMTLMACIIAVCSFITVPFTVPFTFQSFGVFFSLKLLGGKRGTVSIVLYILLGIAGLPVFSGFKGGIGVLMGPTGGFIIGFLLIGIIYMIFESGAGKTGTYIILGFGLVLLYAAGTVWYMFTMKTGITPKGIWEALLVCVIPFVIPDAAKLVLAVFLSKKIKPLLEKI